MQRLLESSIYLILIAVLATLASSAAIFVWGIYKTGDIILNLIDTKGEAPLFAAELIRVLDMFLIAITLWIFSIGIYTLFIEKLTLPKWLEIENLHHLKTKLGNMIILVMIVAFVEQMLKWRWGVGLETLYFSMAIALVSAMLILLNYFSVMKDNSPRSE